MTRTEVFNRAEEMGIDKIEALKHRLRYIREKIDGYKKYVAVLEEHASQCNDNTASFIEHSIKTTKLDIKRLQREHGRLVTPKSSIQGITDDDIQAARDYPIPQLIELNKNNRCKAFCHESDTESMSYNPKTNRLKCFVCDKSFSALDILIEKDGMKFIDAVKELS